MLPYIAALEVLENELSSLRHKSELQESNLRVLKEQKLAEVQKATYVDLICTKIISPQKTRSCFEVLPAI